MDASSASVLYDPLRRSRCSQSGFDVGSIAHVALRFLVPVIRSVRVRESVLGFVRVRTTSETSSAAIPTPSPTRGVVHAAVKGVTATEYTSEVPGVFSPAQAQCGVVSCSEGVVIEFVQLAKVPHWSAPPPQTGSAVGWLSTLAAERVEQPSAAMTRRPRTCDSTATGSAPASMTRTGGTVEPQGAVTESSTLSRMLPASM
eukprot:3731789-Prymnesium_polylepis.1